jgi:hypothetical protein
MKKLRWAVASACLIADCSRATDLPQPAIAPVQSLESGIGTQYIDNTVEFRTTSTSM